MSYKKGFYIMFVLYGISILTIVLSLPDTNTVYGDKDCLQVLAEREIAYQVDNSIYKEWMK
tara:strand:- start:5424 stop:5606 length:183 start_codon:yes stop_codon:yes gene_type:complete